MNSDFATITYTEAIKILEKKNDNFDYKISWALTFKQNMKDT